MKRFIDVHSRRLIACLLLLAVNLALTPYAASAVYIVDANYQNNDPDTACVSDDGYEYFETIESALGASAGSGEVDTILVCQGTYEEGPLSITEDGHWGLVMEAVSGDVIIDNNNQADTIQINQSGVELIGLTILSKHKSGVVIDDAADVYLENVAIGAKEFGIHVENADGFDVYQGRIRTTQGSAIYIAGTAHAMIYGTDIEGAGAQAHGIHVESSSEGESSRDVELIDLDTITGVGGAGVYLNGVDEWLISGVYVQDAGGEGIRIEGGSEGELTRSQVFTVGNNKNSLYLENAGSDTVVHRNCFRSDENASIVGLVALDKDGFGNFWQNNTNCPDDEGDSVCDTSYTGADFAAGVADNFPLSACQTFDVPTGDPLLLIVDDNLVNTATPYDPALTCEVNAAAEYFPTIDEALERSGDSWSMDTIRVCPGDYEEDNLDIGQNGHTGLRLEAIADGVEIGLVGNVAAIPVIDPIGVEEKDKDPVFVISKNNVAIVGVAITAKRTAIIVDKNASDWIIQDIIIRSAGLKGIDVKDGSGGRLTGSTLSNVTQEGIKLSASVTDTAVYENCFFNNRNAKDDNQDDEKANRFDNGLRGNFWGSAGTGDGFSETCTDLEGDGICDATYKVPGRGRRVDAFPLAVCHLVDAAVDHYRFDYDGNAQTCIPEPITVKACLDADCTTLYQDEVTVVLSPSWGWLDGNTHTFFDGSADLQLEHAEGNVTIGTTAASDPLPAGGDRCFVSGIEDPSCTLTFSGDGLAFDVPTLIGCEQATVTLQTCGVLVRDGPKSLHFSQNYLRPGTGTRTIFVNDQDIGAGPVSLDFDGNGVSTFEVAYSDAGEVELKAELRDLVVDPELPPITLTGSDPFVVQPVRFDLSAAVDSVSPAHDCPTDDANCLAFVRAGDPFELRARAVCSDADNADLTNNPVMPNFQLSGIPLTHQLVAPAGGDPGSIAWGAVDFRAQDLGEAVLTDQAFSEVGVFNLTLTPGQYLGTDLSDATTTSASIGRIYPHHFQASIREMGTWDPGCGSFTYVGQEDQLVPGGALRGALTYQSLPWIEVTAKNSNDETTVNYKDPKTFLKLKREDFSVLSPTADASTLGEDGVRLMTLTASLFPGNVSDEDNGIAWYTFSPLDHFTYIKDANSRVGPFDAHIELVVESIQDSDGVRAVEVPLVLKPEGSEIRYGRWVLDSVSGPETNDLAIPQRVEYYSGSRFLTNTADSCSQYNAANLLLGPYTDDLDMGETTASGSGVVTSGIVPASQRLQLSAPGLGNIGSVGLEYRDSSQSWLMDDWEDDDGVLEGPKATATFGSYRGHDRIIYWREVMGP